tara:strand:- start:50 stop:415 length:366 start_codon:yes stop_codon:yes gene_type:complete
MKIYLAATTGEIEWKEEFRKNLKKEIILLDPNPQPGNFNSQVVIDDKLMLSQATHFVAYIQKPTFGTTMEIVYAHIIYKIPVYIINPSMEYFKDPWLNHHCDIFYSSTSDCIQNLNKIFDA